MKLTLQRLAERIDEAGGKAYLVGGAVRDEILGRENKDFDVEVFGLSEEKLHSILEGFVADLNWEDRTVRFTLSTVGKSFQVFKLRDYEGNEIDVSLPRRDRKMAAGHKGFEVTADPTMTVKEAASRRDFTINSISKNILTGEIVDPFNGKQDLEAGVIRMTNKKVFAEDPLRVLRAIQFAARFNFYIEPSTFLEMLEVDLTELPAERIFGEIEKLLMKAERPSFGLNVFPYMTRYNAVSKIFPELDALTDVPQDPKWHPEGSVLTHTMLVIDEAATLVKNSEFNHEERLTVMLAALCHDFGKPATTELDPNGYNVHAHGHSAAGLEPTRQFLDRLNIHTINGFDVRGQVLAIVEHHLSPPQLHAALQKDNKFNYNRTLRRMSQRVRLDLLAVVSLADMVGRKITEEERQHSFDIYQWFVQASQNLGVEDKPVEPILRGRDLLQLGMLAGPLMGTVLKDTLEQQIEGNITTLEEAKTFACMRATELETSGA